MLISKTAEKRGKLVGSAVFNLKEWPMNVSKRKNVRLSRHAWLDLSLFYEYSFFER